MVHAKMRTFLVIHAHSSWCAFYTSLSACALFFQSVRVAHLQVCCVPNCSRCAIFQLHFAGWQSLLVLLFHSLFVCQRNSLCLFCTHKRCVLLKCLSCELSFYISSSCSRISTGFCVSALHGSALKEEITICHFVEGLGGLSAGMDYCLM